MNDCLVIKLKGTVDNSNLKKLGYISVKTWNFSASGNLAQFDVIEGKTANLRITDNHSTITEGVGNCTMVDSKTGVIYPKGIEAYNGLRILVNSGDYINFDIEKYYIKTLSNICDFDLSELESCYNLTSFRCDDKGRGDIKVFKDLPISSVMFSATLVLGALHHGVFGDVIETFGSNTALSSLALQFTRTTLFTIESFVAAQRAAGRTTTVVDGTDKPISISVTPGKCTYEGNDLDGKYQLSWTSDSISFVKG